MSKEALTPKQDEKILPEAWEKLLVQGELQQLNSAQRAQYYLKICSELGLNHLTRPMEYLTLQGKTVLYFRKDGTDQLRKINNVSVHIVSREKMNDLIVVTAKALLPNGRADEAVGAVFAGNMKGADLANAMMKAETKAKRRVTLSICGLGFMDESEIEDVKHQPQETYAPPEYLPGFEPRMTAQQWVTNFKDTKNAQELFASMLERLKGTEFESKFVQELERQGVGPVHHKQEPIPNRADSLPYEALPFEALPFEKE